MDENDRLLDAFEQQRGRLRAVAYRMLGSASEADDAVQETWLRATRAGTADVENLAAWLTTVTGRVCLNMLRTRATRREEPLEIPGEGAPALRPDVQSELRVPDQIGGHEEGALDPEGEALLVDSVGLAMLVVLDRLTPAERLAFVLHDLFAVPFDEIGPLVERSAAATRQLASRARRRVRGGAPAPGADLARQRRVIDAFLAASRGGDLDALVAVLDPDVVLRADPEAGPTPAPLVIRGAKFVAQGAGAAAARVQHTDLALIDGEVGLVMAPYGRLFLVLRFRFDGDRITDIDVVAAPERLEGVELAVLGE
jgi:RNA polymerase sigma-70 factor (ECF subfamily)